MLLSGTLRLEVRMKTVKGADFGVNCPCLGSISGFDITFQTMPLMHTFALLTVIIN